jgi:hypothetical protein
MAVAAFETSLEFLPCKTKAGAGGCFFGGPQGLSRTEECPAVEVIVIPNTTVEA